VSEGAFPSRPPFDLARQKDKALRIVAPPHQEEVLRFWKSIAGVTRPLSCAIALALAGLAAPAFAISPYDGFTCEAGSTTALSFGPFPSIPASEATVHVAPEEGLRVFFTYGADGTLRFEDHTLIAFPYTSAVIIPGPFDGTLVIPQPGIGGKGDGVSVTFACDLIADITRDGVEDFDCGPAPQQLRSDIEALETELVALRRQEANALTTLDVAEAAMADAKSKGSSVGIMSAYDDAFYANQELRNVRQRMDEVTAQLDRLRPEYAAVCPVTPDSLLSPPDRAMLAGHVADPLPVR
jgi:hypothetical protein